MKFDSVFFTKLLLLSVFFHSFPVYFTGSGAIGTLSILISSMFLLIITLNQVPAITSKFSLLILVSVPFCLFGFVYVFFSAIDLKNKFSFIVSFLLPLLSVIAYIHMKNMQKFVLKMFSIFTALELIICLGQMSTYMLGFGLPVSEEYLYMITGTFYNSNDLAAVVLSCCVVTLIFQSLNVTNGFNCSYIWIFSFALLIITLSRTALLLFILLFIISCGKSIVKYLLYSVSLFAFLFIFNPLSIGSQSADSNSGVENRIFSRMNSIFDIAENGVEVDGSLSLRIKSYSHYFSTLDDLSWGTGEYSNYGIFFHNADFDYSLISSNPHSLIIELSYWQGYIGLFSFLAVILAFICSSVKYIFYNIFSILMFLLITTIPSSSLLLYPVLFLMFYVLMHDDKKVNYE